MKADTFSNDSVIRELNNSFIPVYIDLTSRQPNKYSGQYGVSGIPHTTFLNPDGTEVSEKKIVGNPGSQALLQALKKFVPQISWKDDREKTIEEAERLVRPAVVLTLKENDDDSEDLMEHLTTGGTIVRELGSKFVWFRHEIPGDSEADASIEIIDPFSKESVTDDIRSINRVSSKLRRELKKFERAYVAKRKWFCVECGKVRSSPRQKECCDRPMKQIITFRCSECGMASSRQKECHGKDMEPFFDDLN